MAHRRSGSVGLARPSTFRLRAWTGLGLYCALGACLDLDGLRERLGDASTDSPASGDAEAECTRADRRMVRFWKLALGKDDYVTLKNTGPCSIELGGMQLTYDDRDELGSAATRSCIVQVPATRLESGAEVRVHSDPRSGDIDFHGNVVGECPEDFAYDPDRGGVTYLCDAACEPDTVIDVVAHSGQRHATPRLRFGQTFDAPLAGVDVSEQDTKRFRRVATEGEAPSFTATDWQLETRYVYAGFEDGVEVVVDGTSRDWLAEDGQNAAFGTSLLAAEGAAGLQLTHRGNDGRSDGLAIELTAEQGVPVHVSYFARVDGRTDAGAYFDLQDDGFSAIQAGFEPTGLGTEIENHQRTEVVVDADAWHQVEFRNLDWPARRYDLYVDRVLIGQRVKFWTNATAAERLSLYSVSAGSTVLWDEIELWRDDLSAFLQP